MQHLDTVSEYKITLRYPDLPLVDVGGQKSNLLPPELCEILPNQAFKGKLTDDHTANMITAAAKPPNVNATSIVGPGLDELGFRPNASSQLKAFGIAIGNEMTVIPGRILPLPAIKYGQGSGETKIDDRASWNLRNVKFTKGARLEKWGVLLIKDGNPRDEFASPDDPGLLSTIRGFAKMCRDSGMIVGQADPLIRMAQLPQKNSTDPTRAAAIGVIRQQLMSFPGKPSIVLVLLSSGDKHIYSGIKHLCDSHLDLGKLCSYTLYSSPEP